MSVDSSLSVKNLPLVGVDELKKKWGWFVALGIVLIIGGTVAIGSACLMTVFSVILLGWLMIGGGVLEVIHAFGCKKWSGFFIDLLTGLLYIVAGFFVVASPVEAGVTLTLIIALFLILGGIARVLVSLFVRFQHWGWVLLNGVVSVTLGFMIFNKWPSSGLWVIGLFVGIDMIFNGWSLVMLGLTAKNLPGKTAGTQAA